MDPFYRYKVPSFSLKYEGNKTIILNLIEIAKKIERPIGMLKKFYAYQLGTSFITKNDRHIINGILSTARMDKCLQEFMRLYVLCGTCSNPETIIVKGKLKCRACGAKTILDPNHKMTKYCINS